MFDRYLCGGCIVGDCLYVGDYCWLICDIRNVHWQWNGIVGVDNVTYMLSSVVCECIWFKFDVIVVWYFCDHEYALLA